MLSTKTLDFLEDLKKNNHREWFQENKSRYETAKKDYYQLIADLLEAMVPHDSTLEALEPKDCAFRINRDIRFSKDKTPYKTHLGVWMTIGKKSGLFAGYYIHMEKGASFVGGGLYMPPAEELKKVRKEIAYFAEDLEEILNEPSFKKIYGTLDRNDAIALKNAPKGYDVNHPAIEYLKLKSFTATHQFDDKLLTSKDFVSTMVTNLVALKPLIDYLNRGLTTE
ncbi:DUF2461 domain-containing protein [Flavobacterium sp. '19STA2R22 D10 B1']|uniref:DUF2461 domain-containing protein n=1 Tax=Flavobacterium aerium TaxID=3037261 RepID=UPI00278C25FD|nr:DUF2461 domain-containing protein [Flavobacterium sp. '19STA2R22 D10 B1']